MSRQNQKRHCREGQNGVVRKPVAKLRAYKSFFALNRGFEIALTSGAELKKLGFLTTPQWKRFQAMVEELRAGTNHRVAEAVRDYEERDWARFGKLSSQQKDQG